MNKKELKELINKNGFFLHVNNLTQISKDEVCKDENFIKTSAKKLEGENIIVFRGLATQKFEPGEKSRNGYKIDVDGWNFENYKKNPQILLQHEDNQPIGQALSLKPHKDGVDIEFYVNLKAMHEVDAERVRTGLFSALSTGHITNDYEFENDTTGERLTPEEFSQLPFDERNGYTLVVTDAEMAEVSMVSIGSNPDALTLKNSLEIFYKNNVMPKMEKNNQEETSQATEATEKETVEKTGSEPVEETPKEEEVETTEKEKIEEVQEGETPEATEEESENGSEEVEETPKVESENTVTVPKELIERMANLIKDQEARIKKLENTVDVIPNKRPLKMKGQVEEEKQVKPNNEKSKPEKLSYLRF